MNFNFSKKIEKIDTNYIIHNNGYAIKNKPVIDYWFDKFEKIEVKDVLINTHHLHEKVEKYLKTQHFRKFRLQTVYEDRLLGTAATLIKNKNFFFNSFMRITLLILT